MRRTIIALRGKKDSGKTTTIWRICRQLFGQGRVVHSAGLSQEVRGAVVEIDGVKVGIISPGDDVRVMRRLFADLVAQDCDVIVCATRSFGKTEEFVKTWQPEWNVIWVEKERVAKADRDQQNEEKAEEVIDEVRKAVERNREAGSSCLLA